VSHRKAGSGTLALGLAWVLAGCTVGPDYQPPDPPAPSAWLALPSETVVTTDDAARLEAWWRRFGDPVLDALVTRALADNLDARIAQARLAAARGARRQVVAGSGPEMGLGVGASRYGNPLPGLVDGLNFSLYEAGFDARWEIDVFGRQRRRIEAASATLEAAAAERRAVLASLAAEVVRLYLEVRTLERRIELASATVRLAREAHALRVRRGAAGVDSRHEALQASAAATMAAADVPPLVGARTASIHQLELLLAVAPGELSVVFATPAKPQPPVIPDMLLTPAAVIRARPDIQRAERELAAATALKAAAIADMYPRLSLAAFFGARNTALGMLLNGGSRSWSASGDLLVPLFDSGRLRAAVDIADARIAAAIAAYDKAVLGALHETEIALTHLLEAEQRRHGLAVAAADLRENARLTGLSYRAGVDSRIETLAAERAATDGASALVGAEGEVATYTVAVFKALGAGLPVEPEPSPAVAVADPSGTGPNAQSRSIAATRMRYHLSKR
jgi:NodT family efflux transporter outer membrane factor (OMF) lipoprotein